MEYLYLQKGCAEDYPKAEHYGEDAVICMAQNCDMELAFAMAQVQLKEWLSEHEGGGIKMQTPDKVKEKLVELLNGVQDYGFCRSTVEEPQCSVINSIIADHLIAHGVTVQEWISASEPPKENGYYLCVILFSAVGNKKEYRRKILFWEDNVWIEMANCFRTVKPLYWMPMAEMPQPPKGE